LTAYEYQKIITAEETVNHSAIDNNVASTEIGYVSGMYVATGIEIYKGDALAGERNGMIEQYPKEGWPQFREGPHKVIRHT